MIEYWLQKKTIGGWSHVTWYSNIEQAQINYDKLRQQAGYSYRLVEVKVVQEHMLEEVVPVEAPSVELEAKANVWGGQKNNGWKEAPASVGALTGWQTSTPKQWADAIEKEHGLSGSVWLIHHANKHKGRFPANVVDDMIAKGYVRGGPRTQFQ